MEKYSPERILKEIGDDRIVSRIYSLEQIYNKLMLKWSEHIELNLSILRHCVESYHCDVFRTKIFHNIDFADQHKRAAYTMLWISKLKPIQISSKSRITKALLMINEYYGIACGLDHLNISTKDLLKIEPKYFANMLYTLHNRNVDGLVLSSQIYLLEKALKPNGTNGVD
ncbi:MAG: hypothetical protein HQK63_06340 [Desulfamplus sp.]|nr:hypothetical protein [Desulfamplus sp.]